MRDDASQAFLDSLPELKEGETFLFACHPGVACFNACCGDLNLVLAPYDVLRLRRGLGLASPEFIGAHVEIATAPGTGFPLVRLKMLDDRRRSCPYVRDAGCSIYPDRPSACRTYPLGRATRLSEDDRVVEQYFVVKEPHCKGFREGRDWKSSDWLKDQGLEPYAASNDAYMALMGRWRRTGRCLDGRKAGMVLLALYQTDSFQRFVADMKVMDRLDMDEARKAAVLADEETALAFAMDWLELVLLGSSPGVRPKS